MPRILGSDLPSERGQVFKCEKSHACHLVPHHDHMYDFIHRRILDILSPRDPIRTSHRAGFGREFASFLRKQGQGLTGRIGEQRLSNGSALIRFKTTHVCSNLNAVDGNGKNIFEHRHLNPDHVKYWSMTPAELINVRSGKTTWLDVFNGDTELQSRLNHARLLIDSLVDQYRKASRP